jgi:hypothetical protein
MIFFYPNIDEYVWAFTSSGGEDELYTRVLFLSKNIWYNKVSQ